MYGLPSEESFGFFVGLILLQACFGRHEIILKFDADTAITIEGDLGILEPDGSERLVSDPRQAAGVIVSFITQSVTQVEPNSDGTLVLAFGSGWSLKVYDSSEHYESYQIKHGAKLYVI
jgi:Family of unknown function (DUF6188)